MAIDLEALTETAERVAGSWGLDVVEVEFTGAAKHRILRVAIEKNAEGRARLQAQAQSAAEGDAALPTALIEGRLAAEHLSGVTHEDCANFSRDFGTVIDVEDLVPGGEYTLEVSSPGLDRKLSRVEDYARFRGSLVKLQTFAPVSGNRYWQGRLTEADGQHITLDLAAMKQKKAKKGAEAPGRTVRIEIANIEKANLIPEI
jgi:ribosome maturation factor RimP